MIAIITYETPHRKTQELVARLRLEGYSDLHLIALPFVKRKGFVPIYRHRPSHCAQIDLDTMSKRLNLGLSRMPADGVEEFLNEQQFDHVLIGGAGLLPDSLAKNHDIINSHPGYLPEVRGLDSLKWAIYNGKRIGVTTHYITDSADEGRLIERRLLHVEKNDTFHSLAYRQYEMEIDMLVEAIALIDRDKAPLSDLHDDRYQATRRMPNRLEEEMMVRFESLRVSD